ILYFFFQAEDGIRDRNVTGVQTCALPICYSSYQIQTFSSISEVLETYYATRNLITRIRQKSAELRRVIQTHLERSRKKYDLQLKQLKDTQKREKYRIYGELLNTYGYEAKEGDKQITRSEER